MVHPTEWQCSANATSTLTELEPAISENLMNQEQGRSISVLPLQACEFIFAMQGLNAISRGFFAFNLN